MTIHPSYDIPLAELCDDLQNQYPGPYIYVGVGLHETGMPLYLYIRCFSTNNHNIYLPFYTSSHGIKRVPVIFLDGEDANNEPLFFNTRQEEEHDQFIKKQPWYTDPINPWTTFNPEP